MQYAMFALLMVGCIFAVIEIIRTVMQNILLTKKILNTITVLPISGRIDDIEYIVRSILWKKDWESTSEKIILLNLGADEETINICKNLANDNEIIEFLDLHEMEVYLKK